MSGNDPTTPLHGTPDYLPQDPSESMRPPAGDSQTMSDPNSRLRALIGHDIEVLTDRPADPSAYLLRGEVGHGTFGEVLEAVQVALHRVVAVKRPRTPDAGSDSERADQSRISQLLFHKEALTTSHLDHPNIVPVYDLGTGEDGRPLLAMKLVDGVSWAEKLRQDAALSLADRLTMHVPILLLVARAVMFAHSRGIIHRDLKPAQVMVGNFGEVFLMDWGSAISMPGAELEGVPASNFATPRDMAPNPAGTVAYMAPEQTLRTPDQLGPWTDVYLLGAMLYEVLTAGPPHPQARAADAFLHAARGVVEPPEERTDQTIPADLSMLCMWAVAPRVQERMQTAAEFVDGLERWLSGANLREQSRSLASDAESLLGDAAPGYEALEKADALLVRALHAWSENPKARELHQIVLTQFAESAVAQGDLRLAATQAERVPHEQERDRLRAVVARAERTARRHRLQRRLAIAAGFLLLVGLSGLGVVIRSNAERDRIIEHQLDVQKRKAQHDIEIATRKQADETRRGEQLQELGKLRDSTTAFVNRVVHELPIPDHLEPPRDWAWNYLASQPEKKVEFANAISAIRKLRDRCRSYGFTISPEPVELLSADGTLLLEGATGNENPEAAYQRYETASTAAPYRFEAFLGMAIAAGRKGDITAGTAALEKAINQLTKAAGYFDTLSILRSEFIKRSNAGFVQQPGDIIMEAWAKGQNSGGYRELTNNWGDGQRLGGYKSMAAGLTAKEVSGARVFSTYEPFRKPIFFPPASARFTPDPPAKQKFHVYTTWPARANAWPVRYSIKHPAGETTIALVQDGWGVRGPANSSLWVSLGEFEFAPGTETYVQLEAARDVRPVTPQRHGEVVADAMYFSTRPLDRNTTAPLLAETMADELALAPPLPFITTPTLTLMDNYDAARAMAQKENRTLLVFVYQPVSSIFTHPLNRFRDYVENRLLSDPDFIVAAQEHAVVLGLDASRPGAVYQQLGVNRSETSLCICSPDGKVRERLMGEALLIPPIALIQKLTLTGQ